MPSDAQPLARRRRGAASPRPRVVDAATALLGLGLGATIALGLAAESSSSLQAPGGWLTFGGRITGLIGGYLMLVTVLLAGRLPVIERTLGHDRLIAWHRRLAPSGLILIALHGVLTLLGYAQAASTGVLAEAWSMVSTLSGVLLSVVGFGLLVMAGVSSIRAVRRRVAHETWWAIHLYTYLGLALSWPHQVATGASFVGRPAAQLFWTVLWAGTAGAVLVFRVGVPVWRSLRHRLRVEEVVPEGNGVVSLVLSGRSLDRLPISGGQFLHWRFLLPGMWWQAHPYSISSAPHDGRLRVTVKDLGDHSASLATLAPGTAVAIEGPYGTFTHEHAATGKVLAVAAGVGTTPVRAMLDDLEPGSEPVVIVRERRDRPAPLVAEIEARATQLGGRTHRLAGPRSEVLLDAAALCRLVPDLVQRDLYVCGPTELIDVVTDAAVRCGIPREQIHAERFDH